MDWATSLLARRVIELSYLTTRLAAICLLAGTGMVNAQSTSSDAASADSARPIVVLNTTEGDIVLELDRERAPASVDNFLAYVNDDFYKGTLFHRVIDGFMIQGGGFTEDYSRKQTKPPVSNEAYNGLRNRRYTIAMARTTAPHSATSQFFINTADNANLDHTATTQRGWGYTVFGHVIDGTEVVDAISQTRTGPGGPFSRDAPVEPIVILGASLVENSDSDSSVAPSTDTKPENGVASAIPDNTSTN